MHPNLRFLETEWLATMPAARAEAWLRKTPAPELSRLLRHHSEGTVYGADTERRDELDSLLSYYGIVEIALMIGFVDELPTAHRKRIVNVLSMPAVRRYYEFHYPTALPRRLRERLCDGVAYSLPPSSQLHAVFNSFLDLTRLLEFDDEIESFLWVLDDGKRNDGTGWTSMSTVRAALEKPRRMIHAMQVLPTTRSEVDRALCGFSKFMDFCHRFGDLLRHPDAPSEMADAMWLSQSYWFFHLQSAMGDRLGKAIDATTQWATNAKERTALKAGAVETKRAANQLFAQPTARRRKVTKPQESAPATNFTARLAEVEAATAKFEPHRAKLEEKLAEFMGRMRAPNALDEGTHEAEAETDDESDYDVRSTRDVIDEFGRAAEERKGLRREQEHGESEGA